MFAEYMPRWPQPTTSTVNTVWSLMPYVLIAPASKHNNRNRQTNEWDLGRRNRSRRNAFAQSQMRWWHGCCATAMLHGACCDGRWSSCFYFWKGGERCTIPSHFMGGHRSRIQTNILYTGGWNDKTMRRYRCALCRRGCSWIFFVGTIFI